MYVGCRLSGSKYLNIWLKFWLDFSTGYITRQTDIRPIPTLNVVIYSWRKCKICLYKYIRMAGNYVISDFNNFGALLVRLQNCSCIKESMHPLPGSGLFYTYLDPDSTAARNPSFGLFSDVDPHSFGSVIRIKRYKMKEKSEFNHPFFSFFFVGNYILRVWT